MQKLREAHAHDESEMCILNKPDIAEKIEKTELSY